MVELVDSVDLGSTARACRFESCCPHQSEKHPFRGAFLFPSALGGRGEGGDQPGILIQGGGCVPGHVAAGAAGIPQTLYLGSHLVGAVFIVGLPDGVVSLDPGAHRRRCGSLILALHHALPQLKSVS